MRCARMGSAGLGFLLAALCLFGTAGRAGNACDPEIVLTSAGDRIPLGLHALLYSGGQAVLKRADLEPDRFVSHCAGYFPVATVGQPVWFISALRNETRDAVDWVVVFESVSIDHVSVYRGAGATPVATAGRLQPVAQEDGLPSRKTVVPIRIAPGESMDLTFKVVEAVAPNIVVSIQSKMRHLADDANDLAGLTVSIGFLAAILLVNLLFWFRIRRSAYFHYSGYLLGQIAVILIYDGVLQRLDLLTWSAATSDFFLFSGIAVAMWAMVRFTAGLLRLDDVAPLLNRATLVFGWMALAKIPVFPFFPAWMALAQNSMVVVCLFGCAGLAVHFAARRYRPAFPFVLSFAVLFMGVGGGMLVYYQPALAFAVSDDPIAAYEFIDDWGYHLAVAGEAALASFALSSYAALLKQEAEEARRASETYRANIETLANQLTRPGPEPADKETDATRMPQGNADDRFLERARLTVRRYIAEPGFGVPDLAGDLAVSERTLRRRLQAASNMSPVDFIRQQRLLYARSLIQDRVFATVSEVSNAAGFSSPSHFSKTYKKLFGRSPTEDQAAHDNNTTEV